MSKFFIENPGGCIDIFDRKDVLLMEINIPNRFIKIHLRGGTKPLYKGYDREIYDEDEFYKTALQLSTTLMPQEEPKRI